MKKMFEYGNYSDKQELGVQAGFIKHRLHPGRLLKLDEFQLETGYKYNRIIQNRFLRAQLDFPSLTISHSSLRRFLIILTFSAQQWRMWVKYNGLRYRDRGKQMAGHQRNEHLLYTSRHLCVGEQIIEFYFMSYSECPVPYTSLAFSELFSLSSLNLSIAV